MDILHNDDGKKGVFYVQLNGKTEAEMTYTWAGQDKIIIDHTEVNEVLKGKKVGYKLVEKAVAFARAKNIKILPLCPFAKYIMDKKEDYKDVLF
uniref:GNAT family N-acetyltransferase n=1 Tax=uncultured Polaribacter sp. TaxID=174711 RepID=UPI002638D952|nr:GNAT family N-acetyltransferase [uncultured Polaribacter sp.]